MIHVKSPPGPGPASVTLATSVRRDLEVGRYDHVQQRAGWLQAVAVEAARIADVPMAAVNLMKSTTQRTVAAVGIEVGLRTRSVTMCHAVIDEGRTVHVPDASMDPRWADNPHVDGRWGRIRFYGAHPLVGPSGLVVGTLCVFDERPRELAPSRVEALDALADRVVAELEDSRLAALKAGIHNWSRTFPKLLGR